MVKAPQGFNLKKGKSKMKSYQTTLKLGGALVANLLGGED